MAVVSEYNKENILHKIYLFFLLIEVSNRIYIKELIELNEVVWSVNINSVTLRLYYYYDVYY